MRAIDTKIWMRIRNWELSIDQIGFQFNLAVVNTKLRSGLVHIDPNSGQV